MKRNAYVQSESGPGGCIKRGTWSSLVEFNNHLFAQDIVERFLVVCSEHDFHSKNIKWRWPLCAPSPQLENRQHASTHLWSRHARNPGIEGYPDARCPFENGGSPPPLELERQVLAHTQIPCPVSGHHGCETQTSLAEAQRPPPHLAEQTGPSTLGTTFNRSSLFKNKSQEQSWLQEDSVFSEKSIPKVRSTEAWLPCWNGRGKGITNKKQT